MTAGSEGAADALAPLTVDGTGFTLLAVLGVSAEGKADAAALLAPGGALEVGIPLVALPPAGGAPIELDVLALNPPGLEPGSALEQAPVSVRKASKGARVQLSFMEDLRCRLEDAEAVRSWFPAPMRARRQPYVLETIPISTFQPGHRILASAHRDPVLLGAVAP